MALNIKDPEADRLVRELADRTGESLTETVVVAVRERLARVRGSEQERLTEDLETIALRCAALPPADTRTDEQILGYDEHGLPR